MQAARFTVEHGIGPHAEPDRGRASRHRLAILASDTADAVAGAGGLIFDRANAGWQVTVYSSTPVDDQPLRILGATATDALDQLTGAGERPDAIIAARELYERNATVRSRMLAATRRQDTEIALWGEGWPPGLRAGIGVVEHRLSIAAHAFKTHALFAAGLSPEPTGVAVAERFHGGKQRFVTAAPLLPPA